MSVSALESHAVGAKQKKLINARKSTVDIRMMLGTSKEGDEEAKSDRVRKPIEAPASSKAQETVDHLLDNKENTLNAEILRCLRMIFSHESYNSCGDLSEIFQRIFFDSEIVAKFSLGKTKSRCTFFYGIAPEFKRVLLYDVKSSSFFTVSFDESLNTDLQMCQMNVVVRFWNDKTGLAETKYFDPQFLRRPTVQNLFGSLYESMSELKKTKSFQLAVDGPNVNWNVLDLLDDELVSDNFSKTLNITNCAQHTVHGSLKNGFQKSTWNMDKLLKSIFSILHDSSVKSDVYLQEGDIDKFPLRLVSLRYRFWFKCLASFESTVVLTWI